MIQEGEITVEKCAHRGTPAHRERHTLSLGQKKHGHNNSAPSISSLLADPTSSVLVKLLLFHMFCSWLSMFLGLLGSKMRTWDSFTSWKKKGEEWGQENWNFIVKEHFLFFY